MSQGSLFDDINREFEAVAERFGNTVRSLLPAEITTIDFITGTDSTPLPEPPPWVPTLAADTMLDTAPYQQAPTSRAAAEAIRPKLSARRAEVLALIGGTGSEGYTDNQIIARVAARGGSPNGPRARRIELFRGGLIEQNGERSGCAVWVATKAGRAWLESDE